MIETKICNVCKREKPLSDFAKAKSCVDGHTGKCKECLYKYVRQHRLENKAEYQRKSQEYYQKNRRAILQRCSKYRDEHREKLKAYFRERYRKNKRKILDKQKEYNNKHRDARKQYLRNYYRDKKKQLLEDNLRRQRTRLVTDPDYKLKRQMRLLVWRSFNVHGKTKPAHTEDILGCTLEYFTDYLKQTWLDRYSFEWVGQPCHIDHIIPLCTAKTKEDIIRLCHYTNLQLLTPEDNMAKGDSMEWLPERS